MRIRGKITVLSGSNVIQADCSINPFVQLRRAEIYGRVSGYIYTTKIFRDNPFDPNHYEGGYKNDKLYNNTNIRTGKST